MAGDADIHRRLEEAAGFIRGRLGERPFPRVAGVLGSGLGAIADGLEGPVAIPYGEVPHFPVSTVEGHAGRLVVGRLDATPIALLQGRFHLYEGYDAAEVTFPVRVLAKLGAQVMVITNAAGGINEDFAPGDLMLIEDHINLSGQNPLRGLHDERLGPRFPDMSDAYSEELRRLAREATGELGLTLRQGVYAVLSGPSYETPAEIRMLARIGADAIGMSTIPEVIASRHMGVKVLGISLISNYAAGISREPLTHDEVMETGRETAEDFQGLIRRVVPRL